MDIPEPVPAHPLLGQNIPQASLLAAKLPEIGVTRAELFIIDEADLGLVAREKERLGLDFSIHYPVPRPRDYPYPVTWTFLNYADKARRDAFFPLVESSTQAAKGIGAEYVVVHFPGPITEECKALGFQALEAIAFESAERIAEASERAGVPVHIEGFGPSPFLTLDFVLEVFRRHPNLRYCFDVAHNHIAAQRAEIDYWQFLRTVMPHLGSVHIWQTRHMGDYSTYRHLPVHPTLTPDLGWVDIGGVIDLVRAARPDVPFVMEYAGRFPAPWADLDYREGVRWLDQRISTPSS